MKIMHVKLMGTFEMSYNGKTINYNDFSSSKITELLVYLFKQPFGDINNQDLAQIMFKDVSHDPLNALKSLVYRVRTLLKQFGDDNFIISSKGHYYWNKNIYLDIDLDQFEQYCTLAKQDEKIDYHYYERAVALYNGRLLPMLADVLWVKLENTELEAKGLQVMKELMISYYEEHLDEQFDEMVRKILAYDNYNEDVYTYIIKKHIRENNIELAQRTYKKLETLFHKDLGIDPHFTVDELRVSIKHQENNHCLEEIISSCKQHKSNQAFECSSDEFMQLCALEKRRAKREKSDYHIVDIVVKDEKTKNNYQLGVELKKTILNNLREYDCVLQYDQNKFMVLIDCRWEYLKRVIDRIKNHYYVSNGYDGKLYFQGMNIREYIY